MKRPLPELIRHFDQHLEDQPADPALAHWYEVIHHTVLDRAELEDKDVLLDLGCGTGRMLSDVAPFIRRGVGLDCSPLRLALARGRSDAPNLSFQLGDLRDPPVIPGLSTVMMARSLSLLDAAERRALWGRLHAALPPDGLLVIGDLLWSLPPDRLDGVEGWLDREHRFAPSVDDVTGELDRAGFLHFAERLHPAVAVIRAVRRPR